MSKPLPRLSSGKRLADGVGDFAGVGDGDPVNLGKRLGIEALRAAEHVQAAPVDAGLEQAADERAGRAPHRPRTGLAGCRS